VAKIAAEWTTQPGFPMIEVDARCDAGRRHITLRQEQFRLDTDEPSSERLWSVPIQIGVAGVRDGDFTLLQSRTATLVKGSCDDVLLVDPGNVGYYRVHYAPRLFDALADQLPKLPDGARFKLVADTSALYKANRTSLGGYFKLLLHLGAEPRLALWEQVLGDLTLFDRLSADEPSRASVHRFAVRLIAPRFEQLGWDERADESVEDRQLRAELAQALSYYGDATVINEGRTRFARFLADLSSLPPSLIDSVVHIVGRHADQATYDSLKRLAERAVATEDKFRYYRALGDALDPALAAQTLQLARASEVPQIIRNEIVADVAESGHVDAAWAYAREQVDALLADMTLYASNRYFGDVLETSASTAHADELEAFVTTRLPAGALVNARRTGDEIRTRAKLKARLLPELEAALSGQ
jgi:aminopeptidase N